MGLFGNLANNAYILGKLLRKEFDVKLTLFPYETFALGHPLWEDCSLVLDWDFLMSGKTTRAFWDEKARELNWTMPDWVKQIDINTLTREQVLWKCVRSPTLAINAIINGGKSQTEIKLALKNLHIIESFSESDFVTIFGEGVIFARLSRVPFIAIPYGADLTISAFRTGLPGEMQRAAYAKASRILVGDPDFIECLDKLGLSDRWTYWPCPIDTERYAPTSASVDDDRVLQSLPPSCSDKFIFFMPCRHDFHWKGTDKAVRAFLRLCRVRDDAILITPSWGNDTATVRRIVRENKAEKSVVFLPYVLSKPRLIEFYRFSDVVLDQFVLGSYGTTTLEAMACEKPVIAHIESNKYRPHLGRLPPNLQANLEQEIFEKMRWALENPELLPDVGKRSREWVISEHHEKPIRLLEDIVRGQLSH